MNRSQLVKNISSLLKEGGVRKPVYTPKNVFHISDDRGNSKDFIVKETKRTVMYTEDDVDAILSAFEKVVEEAMKRGDSITVHGFGSLRLHYRKERTIKNVEDGRDVFVQGRYVPKFFFGNNLRMAAKVYEMTKDDAESDERNAVCEVDTDGD